MTDSTDASTAGEEPGPATRAILADADLRAAAMIRAYRAFITHVAACATCRGTGTDCETAANLRQIWRDARRTA